MHGSVSGCTATASAYFTLEPDSKSSEVCLKCAEMPGGAMKRGKLVGNVE